MTREKNRAIAASAMLFFMALNPFLAIAKSESSYTLPETAGTYSVPGRPDLKLRVLVRKSGNAGLMSPAKQPASAPQYVCGLKENLDKDSMTVVDAAGWKVPENWTYRVNAASVPSTIGAANAGILIGNSFNAWEIQLGGKAHFTRSGDTIKNAAKFDGQNIVTWGRASASALAVTYIWYDELSGIANEIDTIMNNRFKWYWSNPSSWEAGEVCSYQGVYDAQEILTHEIGHTVGLDDEYDAALYADNTMYGYGYTGDVKADTLTTGDILGAKAIYGLSL